MLRKLLIGALAAAWSGAVSAAAPWQDLTRGDVEAAYRMLLEDHPGAAKERGDVAFQRRLQAAYDKARGRAEQVNSFEGYVATMAGFAAAIGDKHIWSRPLYAPDARQWAGILIARRGTRFVVADEKDAADAPPLKGAELVSCDEVPADRLADQRLAEFRVVRGIEAQLVQRAYWLLLDDGNPFLERPKSCRFRQAGKLRTVELKWRPIARTEISDRMKAIPTWGDAGLDVRKAGSGWWVGMRELSDKTIPVIKEVEAKIATMRQAPYIVVDVRGNSGGNSQFGRQPANAIWGQAFVDARIPMSGGGEDCSKVWRVSDRNLKQTRYYVEELGPKQGQEAAKIFEYEYRMVEQAKKAGQAFSGKPVCAASTSVAATVDAKPAYAGKVMLLTDNVCFSSCLLVTDMFRKLGALHVGETTDANTNYMEVREDKMPSGLSMFSTLQAVAPSEPDQIGPFVPTKFFEGSIADTPALERWVEGFAV